MSSVEPAHVRRQLDLEGRVEDGRVKLQARDLGVARDLLADALAEQQHEARVAPDADVDGTVRPVDPGAEYEKVIEIVVAGQTFAEALMFLERPAYPVGAQALQPVELISLDARDFLSMLSESVSTCFVLMADMSRRLRHFPATIRSRPGRGFLFAAPGFMLIVSPGPSCRAGFGQFRRFGSPGIL